MSKVDHVAEKVEKKLSEADANLAKNKPGHFSMVR